MLDTPTDKQALKYRPASSGDNERPWKQWLEILCSHAIQSVVNPSSEEEKEAKTAEE